MQNKRPIFFTSLKGRKDNEDRRERQDRAGRPAQRSAQAVPELGSGEGNETELPELNGVPVRTGHLPAAAPRPACGEGVKEVHGTFCNTFATSL